MTENSIGDLSRYAETIKYRLNRKEEELQKLENETTFFKTKLNNTYNFN